MRCDAGLVDFDQPALKYRGAVGGGRESLSSDGRDGTRGWMTGPPNALLIGHPLQVEAFDGVMSPRHVWLACWDFAPTEPNATRYKHTRHGTRASGGRASVVKGCTPKRDKGRGAKRGSCESMINQSINQYLRAADGKGRQIHAHLPRSCR